MKQKQTRKPPTGLQVFSMQSAVGQAQLEHLKLTSARVEAALERYVAVEKNPIGTLIGINAEGIFATDRKNWHSGLPDAFAKPLIFIPWIHILELLGIAPTGSTLQVLNPGATRQ